MKSRRVVVVDDHPLFLDGVVSLLNAAGYEVVGKAEDGKQALALVKDLEPDLVLLDIGMPGQDGLATLKAIKRDRPQIRVVMLTVSDRDEDLFAAIQAGADGYLLKDMKSSEFIARLDGLWRGEAAVDGKTTVRLMQGLQGILPRQNDFSEQLTEREIETLRLLGEGLSNRDIAERLFISENTVKFHVRNILQKLGVQNRTEAVALAFRRGLIEK